MLPQTREIAQPYSSVFLEGSDDLAQPRRSAPADRANLGVCPRSRPPAPPLRTPAPDSTPEAGALSFSLSFSRARARAPSLAFSFSLALPLPGTNLGVGPTVRAR